MSEPEEEVDPECSECFAPVNVRHNSEWTQGESVCDPCAQDLLTEAREVLRLVEWLQFHPLRHRECPVCNTQSSTEYGYEPKGHAPDCRLANQLR